ESFGEKERTMVVKSLAKPLWAFGMVGIILLLSACGNIDAASIQTMTTAPTTTPTPDANKGLSRVLRGHGDIVESVAFSPDSKLLASASDDGTVKLWAVATGQNLKTLTGSSTDQSFNSVAFSPDGTLVAGASDDGHVYAWDVTTGQLSKIF